MIRLIVLHTSEISSSQKENSASIPSCTMENCEEEMKAFIGLQFRSAALKDNLSSR
jgi:hypothetical protein